MDSQMTFPAELERLLKEATEGPWEVLPCSNGGELLVRGDRMNKSTQMMPSADPQLIVFLRNHADAILGLVRAAEDALLALNMGLGQTDAGYEDAIKQAIKARDALTQELAKLNGEGK